MKYSVNINWVHLTDNVKIYVFTNFLSTSINYWERCVEIFDCNCGFTSSIGICFMDFETLLLGS